MPHKGASTQSHNQQALAKPRHQPSERDQQAHQNKPTAQQAATQDPVSQQTHPLQPGKTRVYPSTLTNKQVPVLNLTETSITLQADLQDTFQSLCLCFHGRKESTED